MRTQAVLIVALLALAVTAPILAAVPTTNVTGTIVIPSGVPAATPITLELTPSSDFTVWDTVTGAAGIHAVSKFKKTYTVASSGYININVVPTSGSGADPEGVTYSVRVIAGTQQYTQTWIVPTSGSAVRVGDCIVPSASSGVSNPLPRTGGLVTGQIIIDPETGAALRLTPQTLPATGNVTGDVAWDEATNTPKVYNGTAWVSLAGGGAAIAATDATITGDGSIGDPLAVVTSALTHNDLGGLTTGDAHTQYIHVAGTRAFTGPQSMGQYALTNFLADPRTTTPTAAPEGQLFVETAGDTVNVSLSGAWVNLRDRSTMTGTQARSTLSDFTHASTHNPGQADPLTGFFALSGNTTATANMQMGGYEIENFRVDNLTTDPTTPTAGQVWVNTGSSFFKWYNGSTVIQPLDRSLHTGSQVYTTISNWAAGVQAALAANALTGDLDFGNNEATNFRIENLASDPAAGQAGRIFWSTASGRFRQDTGSAITDLAVGGANVIVEAPITGTGLLGAPLGVSPSQIDHDDLGGLTTGDPHTQYIHVDGSRELSGDWDLGATYRITSTDPVTAQQLATKNYIDSNFVAQNGGSLTADLDFDGWAATNILIDPRAADPTTGAANGQMWTRAGGLYVYTGNTTLTVVATPTGNVTKGIISDFAHAVDHASGGSDDLSAYFLSATTGGTVSGNVTSTNYSQLAQWRMENRTSNPASDPAHKGYLFFNTTLGKFQKDDGASVGDLTATAAFATVATNTILGNTSGGAAEPYAHAVTPFFITLWDDTDAATFRATIGASSGTGNVSITASGPLYINGVQTQVVSDTFTVTQRALIGTDLSGSAAIALSQLATQADLTLVGNTSGGAAVPSAQAITAFFLTLMDDTTDVSVRTTISAASTDHSATHESGGSDAIKLDDLAATDDNTDLDASTAKHGLMMKYPGGTTNYLREDGTWAAASGSAGALFTTTSDVTTTANSTSQFSLIGPSTGTTSTAANSWTAGKILRLNGTGNVNSDASTPVNAVFQLKLGTTVLGQATIALPLGATSAGTKFQWEADVVCVTTGASGTFRCSGSVRMSNEPISALVTMAPIRTVVGVTSNIVDTTNTQPIDWVGSVSVADADNYIGSEYVTAPTTLGSGATAEGTIVQVGSFKGLQLTYADTNTVTMTCDAIDVSNGVTMTMVTSVNVTASVAAAVGPGGPDESGLDTSSRWLYLHLVCKDSGAEEALLFSTDATPILPTDYTHSRLVGCVRNDSSSNLLKFHQFGSIVSMTDGSSNYLLNGGTSTTYATVDCSAFAPPIARAIFGTPILESQSTDAYLGVRVSSTVETFERIAYSSVSSSSRTGFGKCLIPLTGTQTFDYILSGTTPSATIFNCGHVLDL